MKTLLILFTTALLIFSGLSIAGPANMDSQSKTGMGMMNMQSGMSDCSMSMQDEKNLQAHMQKMQSQMSEIMASGDSAKLNEMMQDHMDTINEMMSMMNNLHGDHSQMSQEMMEHDMSNHSNF